MPEPPIMPRIAFVMNFLRLVRIAAQHAGEARERHYASILMGEYGSNKNTPVVPANAPWPLFFAAGAYTGRHCAPTGRANARPMTGSAKQSTGVEHDVSEPAVSSLSPCGRGLG